MDAGAPSAKRIPSSPLPSHVEEALQAMAAMHAAHADEASPIERTIDRVTATIAAPKLVIYVGVAILFWIVGNYLLLKFGIGPSDAPVFPQLEISVGCIALLIAILILASQRRADRLANLGADELGNDAAHDAESLETNRSDRRVAAG